MKIQDNYINDQYQCKTPYFTDVELLQIFPEAKEIIPQKIEEYQEERKDLLSCMQAFRNSVIKIAAAGKKDEFFVWFWAFAYLKYFYAPKVVEIDKHLFRLKRQLRIIQGNKSTNDKISNFEVLKDRAKQQPLAGIALSYLERVRYTGNRITALCPFHKEKTSSFTIYIDQNAFHCFGCQAHGDAIAFKMKMENLSFKDAVRGWHYE